jgi:hypothetical protein
MESALAYLLIRVYLFYHYTTKTPGGAEHTNRAEDVTTLEATCAPNVTSVSLRVKEN